MSPNMKFVLTAAWVLALSFAYDPIWPQRALLRLAAKKCGRKK